MSGEIKINRIKRNNKAGMNLLADILSPEVLHARIPRLADVAEARVEYRNMMNTLQTFGKHTRASGFTPNGQFQYVAQIDQAVWSAILEVFGKYDPESGELMDDGLLYVSDERGNVKLNKDFFYALLGVLQAAGYQCDMRGKVKLT